MLQISTAMFVRASGYLLACIICLCRILLSGGETTLPAEQDGCTTEIKFFYRQVSSRVTRKVECGWFGWWRCTQYSYQSKAQKQSMTLQLCFNDTNTTDTLPTGVTNDSMSTEVDQRDTSGFSDPGGHPGPEVIVPVLVVCSLILITIIVTGVICFRRRRRIRKENTTAVAEGPLDLYVEPEVIRERKRAGISRDELDGTRDHPNSIEFDLAEQSVTYKEKAEDDEDIKESEPTYDDMDDDPIPDKNDSEINREIYINQNFQSAINYDHVELEPPNETSTDDVFQNEAKAPESNPDDYDHIMKVKIN